MAPGRKRGAKGAKTKNEMSLGDLVLAKVKGFPAWPAKISRPEDWKRVPDPKKYFVQFFGTSEIAFVASADIEAFTIEAKNKLSARCQGKTVKYFAQAVKEICEQYEKLRHESSSGTRDDNSEQNFASEHSTDPVVNDTLEVSEKVGTEMNESRCKTEINGLGELGSRLEHCSQRQGKINKLSKDLTNLPSNVKKEGSGHVKAEGRHSDSGQSESANGNQKKLAMGLKNKSDGTVHKNSSSSVPYEHTGDRMQSKLSSDSNMKVSSAGNLKSVLVVGKEKRVVVDKTHSESKDNGRVDAEINLEQSEVISRKRMKTQHGSEKQAFQSSVTTCPAKIPKCTDIGNDASMPRSQRNRKNDSRSPNVVDGKMSDIELKRSTSDGMPQNQQPSRIQINNESNHFSHEDGLPPPKRHRRSFEVMSSSATASESKLGGSASHQNDSVRPNKVRSPVTQLPSKRRAVRLYDDGEDEEIPKTPVHGGFTNKVSITPRAPDSKKKSVVHGECCVSDQMFSRDRGTIDDHSKEQSQWARVSNKAPSPNFQLGLVKMAGELSTAHASPSLSHLDDEKLPSMESRPVSVTPEKSPRSITGTRRLAEQQNTNFSKEPGNFSQKKAPTGGIRVLPTASDRLTSSPHEMIADRSNPASSREKKNAAVKSDSRINDSSFMAGHPNKNIAPLRERVDVVKHDETCSSINAKIPESVMSMKHLIAAAQARKREAHLQSSYGFLFPLLDNEAELHRKSPSPAPDTTVFESSNRQLDVQGLRSISPSADVHHLSSTSQHENEVPEERMLSSSDHAIGGALSGGTEAAVSRDAFEGMIETLSRTKESIGRATRLAIDCAKYGIASEVVELLIHKLENEPSLHHRVDLFFLVDSITQCSHSQKGIAGSSYIPTVQAALDRLIGAAAPPGAGAEENRRQLRKVLRLWIERKIFPEFVLRRYVDDIGVANDDTSAGLSLRRPSRAERAIDDPLREMEGMFVDEYGSNATFQLPGLLSSHVFEEKEEEEEEEEEDSLQTDFCKEIADTSPSERSPVLRDPENCTITPSDRWHRILEDVDGELEMEDVSGHQKDEKLLFTDGTFEVASLEPNSDVIFTSASNKIAEWLPSPEGSPPLPPGSPPVTPPLPTSPPPPPPPLPLSTPLPPPPPLSQQQLFPPLPICPPPVLCSQSLPPQPALMSQHMPSLPSSISTSSTLAFQSPPVLHEIVGTLIGNQHTHTVSSTQGFHIDASVRSEALSQQSSYFPPAGVGKAVEHMSFNSSRTVDYRQCDSYMNLQSSQHRQFPGIAPFVHRPLHPEPSPQHPPTHFSYPKASVQQHQCPSYLLPNFLDGSRYGADESWRMQVNEFSDSLHVGWLSAGRSCSGPPYPHEGYFEPPQERPPINAVNFQPPAPNSVAAATQISVHCPPAIPGRPDMSAVNWRPA